MNEVIKVIGIDCATDVRSTGLSLGIYSKGNIEVQETKIGTKNKSIADTIFKWFNMSDMIILAIDAPLGWPVNLGRVLYSHNAGQVIDIDPNNLFRRETDKFIKRKLGKQPLDVGADIIARTAHAALRIINELEHLAEEKIELSWDSLKLKKISSIEVYPAATLSCYGIQSMGYKEKNQQQIRKKIISGLREHMIIKNNIDIIEQNADALDSMICLLAAKDFIEGNVYYPENIELAQKEGWIWVKKV